MEPNKNRKQPGFIIRKGQNFSLKTLESSEKVKDEKSSDLKSTIKTIIDANKSILGSTIIDKDKTQSKSKLVFT